MARKEKAAEPAAKERVVPTTFHLPESLHTAMKFRAGVKGVSMVDIVIDGVRAALEMEKYRFTDEERKRVMGA